MVGWGGGQHHLQAPQDWSRGARRGVELWVVLKGNPKKRRSRQRVSLAFLKRVLGAPTGRELLHANVSPIHANQLRSPGLCELQKGQQM